MARHVQRLFFGFEQALSLDLSRAPIYFVSKIGICATPDLTNGAQWALVPEVQKTISVAAKADLNESGRCLAFGMPTASGFHAASGRESVAEFYEAKLGKKAGRLGMKACIDQLTETGADKKTMAALDQLPDLHRNPIDHPEEFLEPADALETFNAATVAISKMARQIAALKASRPATT